VKKTSYSYDIFGNLKKVILPDQKVIEYVLDSQNRRVGKRVNGIMTRMYIYQSQTQIAAELDGQGKLINRYVYGTKANSPDYVVSNDQVIKVVADQVGTPRAFVDAVTGAIISKTHFDEFGIKSRPSVATVSELDSIGYAGGLLDSDTGLTHFGAREYSAETGKWLSKDPIGFSGGDTNLYGYVLNDPVNYIDSSGTSAKDVARIQKIYDLYIERMTNSGNRTSPGWLNNMLSGVKGYQGCGEQAYGLTESFAAEKAAQPFDDLWNFEIEELTFGNGTLFPIHQRVRGASSNPLDPTLILDPHKPEYRAK
jgi:RHS repeat-associated protein